MGKNTSISIGEHFENFVSEQVNTGRYSSKSDVVRSGLRLLEEREQKIIKLRKEIQKGIDSGFVEDFDPKEHLAKLHKKYL